MSQLITNLKTNVAEDISKNTMKIQVGNVCLGITCRDIDVLGFLLSKYRSFLSNKKPDLNIEVEIVNKMTSEAIRSGTKAQKFAQNGDRFWDLSGIVIGRYNLASASVNMKVEKKLLHFSRYRLFFNQAMTKFYYSGLKVKGQNVPKHFIIHSSCVIRNKKAILFTGLPKTGKSTLAWLYGREHRRILNDDSILLTVPDNNGTVSKVRGGPFIGSLPEMNNGSVPLLCVVFPKQGQKTELRPLNAVEAQKRFSRQVAVPACLGQTCNKSAFSMIDDFSSKVAGRYPFFELEYNLDDDELCPLLDNIENVIK